MKKRVIKHINFSYYNCPKELVARQSSFVVLEDFNMSEEEIVFVKTANEVLFKSVTMKNKNEILFQPYQTSVICVWFNLFFPMHEIYTNLFADCARDRFSILRLKSNSKKELLETLFSEYIAWLKYLKDSNRSNDVCYDIKDVLEFLFVYNNKMYLFKSINRYLNDNSLRLNPFIFYWLRSYWLRNILNLPIETLFMPDIALDEVQNLKKIKTVPNE